MFEDFEVYMKLWIIIYFVINMNKYVCWMFICDLVVYFKSNVYGVKSLLVYICFFFGLLEGSKMIIE